jgi:hypothetical protein
MRLGHAWLLALALWVAPSASLAQGGGAPTRTFAGSAEQVWDATQSVLRSLGWSVDEQDKPAGWIVTESRGLDFKEFGVYGEGTRHQLRVTVKAAGAGQTAVTVEREVYREERILWMKDRKTIPATDRNVETAVLDGIERAVPAVATAPAAPALRPAAPGPPATPPPATPPPPPPAAPVARPAPSRGEFTYKVTYRVRGTAGAVALTYRNAQGGTEQSSVRLPWELSFDAKGGSFLYVSAQNQGATGSVTCEILLDDESRTTSTSNGAYVIAECSNAAERN